MITVIVPAFNAHADLPTALRSLQLQTFTDWSCIVVDDGSKDPLAPVVEAFADPRVRVVRHPENRGRGAARVTGLAQVKTPYVAWQDADDWSLPGRFERQLEAITAERSVHFVSPRAVIVDALERPVSTLGRDAPAPRYLKGREIPNLVHPALLFRASVLERFHYDARFRTSEDHAFLMGALREYAFVEIPDVLYAYREEQSRSLAKYRQSVETRVRVAAAMRELAPVDRAALVGTHLGKLAVVALLTAVGRRGVADRHAQGVLGPEALADYEAALAQLRAKADGHAAGGNATVGYPAG